MTTLLEIEQRTEARAVAPFVTPFARLLALLLSVWPGDDASDAEKREALNSLNLEEFMVVLTKVEQDIVEGATEAFVQGIESGIEQAGTVGRVFKRTLPIHLGISARAVQRLARRRVDTGSALLQLANTLGDAQIALAVANPAPAVATHTRWLTNRASNEGITMVADVSSNIVTVWVAERDACVHCLAYQGQKRGRMGYPAGLTFGKKPLSDNPVSMPPLHPNCRCTQMLLKTVVAQPVIDGLKREAQRSILRGWSVESESQSVRLEAARKLLNKNPAVPKTVQAYARSSIKAGKFKRGRDFPK